MNKPRPGVRYHAAMATTMAGEMALAIAHLERGEPVFDAVRVTTVAGGEAGIDAGLSRTAGRGARDHLLPKGGRR